MCSQDDEGNCETDSEDSVESGIELTDWPKLCPMPPHEWFLDTKGYTQYKDQDKGHLKRENIFPQSETKLTFIAYPERSIPCSFKFLRYMLQDLILIHVSHCSHRS